MADITMCLDNDCPKNNTCYRYTAKADPHWQSYFVDSPREDDSCEYYWGDKLVEYESHAVNMT